MKIRLLLVVVGLATSLALPTFAQTSTPDPQLREASRSDHGRVKHGESSMCSVSL